MPIDQTRVPAASNPVARLAAAIAFAAAACAPAVGPADVLTADVPSEQRAPDDAAPPPVDAAPPPVDAPADAPRGPDAVAPSDGGVRVTSVAAFDPSMGQFPENLALHDDHAYVSLAPLGQIARVAPDGTVSAYGSVPMPPANMGFATGVTFDARGNLYVALANFAPAPTPGIYRIAPGGGAGTLYVSDPALHFPNAMAFDPSGNMFFTESGAGAIWKVTPAGAASVWLAHPTLVGDNTACGPMALPFNVGANGIVVAGANVWAVNTDRGLLVRVPVNTDGTAGTPVIVANSCERLRGADGLALDADGALLIAVNARNTIVRAGTDGALADLATGGLLDNPSGLERGTLGARTGLFVTSFALFTASGGGMAHPALVELDR